METGVIVAIITAVEGVGCALIALLVSGINRKNEQYRIAREQKEAIEKAEQKEKEAAKAEFDAAKLDLLYSVANGTDVVLQYAHGEKVNGNVEAARESIKKAKAECNRITNREVVKHI